MKLRFICVGVVALECWLGFPSASHADLIVGYNQSGATQAASGVTNAGISRGSGVTEQSGGFFSTVGWTTAASLDPADYIQWGFTATPGYQSGIDLTNMTITYGRNVDGPGAMLIDVSINGGAFTTVYTDLGINNFINIGHTIDLSSLNNATSAIFRLYAYEAANSTGQFHLSDFGAFATGQAIKVNGVAGVAAAPEPGSFVLFGFGGLSAALYGWRRRNGSKRQNS